MPEEQVEKHSEEALEDDIDINELTELMGDDPPPVKK
jgi:hypothetical protein